MSKQTPSKTFVPKPATKTSRKAPTTANGDASSLPPPPPPVDWSAAAKEAFTNTDFPLSEAAYIAAHEKAMDNGASELSYHPSIELRVWGLSSRTKDSAKNAILKALDELNIDKPGDQLIPTGDPRHIDMMPSDFHVRMGEASLPASKHQSSQKILLSNGYRQRKATGVEDMGLVLQRLVERGYEAFWSSGNKQDRRCIGTFYATSDKTKDTSPNLDAFGKFIEELCTRLGHPTTGNFRAAPGRPARSVSFLHAASATAMLTLRDSHIRVEKWGDYEIDYEVPSNFIPVRGPTTIATTGVDASDPQDLLAEVLRWVTKYNEARGFSDDSEQAESCFMDAQMHFDKFFSVTTSSIELSKFICEQIPRVGTPYEFLYDLNEHGLTALERHERLTARDKARDREWKEDKAIGVIDAVNQTVREMQASIKTNNDLIERRFEKQDQIMLALHLASEHNKRQFLGLMDSRDEVRDLQLELRDLDKERRRLGDKAIEYEYEDSPKGRAQHGKCIKDIADIDARLEAARGALDKAKTKKSAVEAYKSPATGHLERMLDSVATNLVAVGAGDFMLEETGAGSGSTPYKKHKGRIVELDDRDRDGDSFMASARQLHSMLGIYTAVSLVLIADAALGIGRWLYQIALCRRAKCYTNPARLSHMQLPREILIVLVLLLMAQPATAASTSPPLNVITLNCNALTFENPIKCVAIAQLIRRILPHVVVFTETCQKATTPVVVPSDDTITPPYRLAADYNVHHTPRALTNQSTGVTILVRKDLHIAATLAGPHNPHAQGRIAALDLAIPDFIGRLTTVRIIGIYAPTAPISARDTSNLSEFWSALFTLTQTDDPWVLCGDFNATLHDHEMLNGARAYNNIVIKLRQEYQKFLNESLGMDAWSHKLTTSISRDWTCRAHTNEDTKKILDRFTVSQGLHCSYLESLEQIPQTNHRPVCAHIKIGAMIPRTRASNENKAPPRLRQPFRDQASEAFETMNGELTRLMQVIPPPVDPAAPLTSTDDYDALLSYCDAIFTQACKLAFKRGKSPQVNPAHIPAESPRVAELGKRKVNLGKLITAVEDRRLPQVLIQHAPLRREFESIFPSRLTPLDPADTVAQLKSVRNGISTELRRERKTVVTKLLKANTVKAYKKALKGGGIKALFRPHDVTNPPFLQRTQGDGSTRIASQHTDKLDMTTDHFRDLLQRPQPPTVNKPWMQGTVTQELKKKTAGNKAFQWPRPMTLGDMRNQMAKGNPRPSPGPDGWEKWALRRANDEFLSLTLLLCNYSLTDNYFPAKVKEHFITPIYKKGDPTDLNNYRGVIFANYLYSLISAWFAHSLQRYVWQRTLLPPLQIATQQGVQAGDLISFLNQAHHAAQLNQQTIYAIKRDHTKGFDYLHISAFFDALRFYGIDPNLAITQFESARTAEITLRVKSQDGIARRTITTTGQTKQGDATSPIKYTLSMGMLTHWLAKAGILRPSDISTIQTWNGANGHRHHKTDAERLQLTSVEAMDDSILFATSWTALGKAVGHSEAFQTAYGIQTAWDSAEKTVCFTLGKEVEEPPGKVVSFSDGLIDHQVQYTTAPSILRTKLHDPQATMDAITEIITEFPIPQHRRYPLSIINKAVKTLLVPRIRPRLMYQPLPLDLARNVDSMISRKVTDALGIKHTATPILSLPVDHRGFGFPSIFRINGEVAVQMILRALNHHIPSFRIMAKISMTNWECRDNNCLPVLETAGYNLPDRPSRNYTVPPEWRTAVEYLKAGDLTVTETNQSYIDKASITHIARRSAAQSQVDVPEQALQTVLAGQSRATMNFEFPEWLSAVESILTTAYKTPVERAAARTVLEWSRDPRSMKSFVINDNSVFITPKVRLDGYLNLLQAAFSPDIQEGERIWATDGSAMDAIAKRGSTTAAIVGPSSAKFLMYGQYASSLHGEMLALCAALVATAGQTEGIIVSDHLNTVRHINRIRQPTYIDDTWRDRPAYEYYALLERVVRKSDIEVRHIKAHTDADDEYSKLNAAADSQARAAHHAVDAVLFPPLTALMQPYSVYKSGLGYVPNNWKRKLDEALQSATYDKLTITMRGRLQSPHTQMTNPIPTHYYLKDLKGSTAKFQLLLRTGQFTTNHRLARDKPKDYDPACDFCRAPDQTEHHIFVECPHFESYRRESIEGARIRVDQDKWDSFREFAESTIRGSDQQSRYWLGIIPRAYPQQLEPYDLRTLHHTALILSTRIAAKMLKERQPILKHEADATERSRIEDEEEEEFVPTEYREDEESEWEPVEYREEEEEIWDPGGMSTQYREEEED